jgi:3-oxoadipate enol-lactonase
MSNQARHAFVKTSHGRIHYLEAGSAGEALVLLHSNGWSAYEYEHVLAPLAARHRVLAWDMPGHGDSEGIARHYTIGDYSDAVIEFMDKLGIAKAHVLGSSVGGSICIDLGARYGARMASLFIVETPARSFEEWGNFWNGVEMTFATAPQSFEQVAPRVARVTPALMTRWNIDRNKAGVRVMMDVMWAIREFDVTVSLPKVAATSFVVYGEAGPVLDGRKVFEKHLPAAEVVVMPRCGHFPMLDEPADFVKVVLDRTAGR